MKVVILAGGLGTRLSEYTESIPKPLVKVGSMPIIWHIMKIYSQYGYNEFILPLGYKGELIKEFFLNLKYYKSDFTIDTSNGEIKIHKNNSDEWKITLVDTGLNTMTGGRLLKLKKYIGEETFFLTYGDGLANVNIKNLLEFHQENKKMVTMTAVKPTARLEPKNEFDTLNPLTAYAKSKVAVEKVLQRCNLGNGTTATSLRFATACGMSDRLRLDLVLNDFVASAVINNRIEILSDGSPWRPLIHVKDMSRAIEWAILRDKNISTPYLAVNTGSSSWNYQVSELAKAVANNVSNCEVSVNTQALPDKRSYKVNFDLFRSLAPNHTPIYTLQDTISELIDGISDIRHLISDDFRASDFIRLHILEKHLKNRMLSRDLRWT